MKRSLFGAFGALAAMALFAQPAFASGQPAGCPIASQVCHEILSLPLHPAMHDDDVDAIADAVNAFDS